MVAGGYRNSDGAAGDAGHIRSCEGVPECRVGHASRGDGEGLRVALEDPEYAEAQDPLGAHRERGRVADPVGYGKAGGRREDGDGRDLCRGAYELQGVDCQVADCVGSCQREDYDGD